MTPTHNPPIAPLIQSFFTQHLQLHKRVSPQTVAGYRDTFRLLFQFIKEQTGREPATLHITDLDAAAILSFLDSLEQQRHNSVRSRNVRLAAIRTFFRWEGTWKRPMRQRAIAMLSCRFTKRLRRRSYFRARI